jgi:hypothetical protein
MPEFPASCTIQVDMQVGRYQEFEEDGMVQVWGHVGDYEVSVWLPITDERLRLLRPASPASPRRRRASR